MFCSPRSDSTFLLPNTHRNTWSGRDARSELLGTRCTSCAIEKCHARRAPRPSRPRRSRWCHRRPLARSASPRTSRVGGSRGRHPHCHFLGWDREKVRFTYAVNTYFTVKLQIRGRPAPPTCFERVTREKVRQKKTAHTNDAGTVWFPAVGAAVAQPAGNHTTERIVPLVGCDRCASHHRSQSERER